MTDYVIAHATRQLAPDDPRRPRQTIESLTELPDPTDRGHVSYLTGRRIELPGFSGGDVWAQLSEAAHYPTAAAARKVIRGMGRRLLVVVELDAATDWERRRHVARARAKARRI